MSPTAVRDREFPRLLETFVVSGIVSVLGIRAVLTVTGFPRLGTGGLHIAHMLWGGALMLLALLLLLAFIDRRVERAAVVIAGLGFGTFIDEIGKFVTADNDYFYRPAVALIYVVFVAVFIGARAVLGSREMTERDALVNALQLVARTYEHPLEPEERARIRALLRDADPESPLVGQLTAYLAAQPRASADADLIDDVARPAQRAYARVVADRRFERGLTVAILAYAVATIVGSTIVIVATRSTDPSTAPTAIDVAQALSSVVGGLLVLRGALLLRSSRAEAYRWFTRGLLVWILVTQVFVFYASQLAGISGLAAHLVVYATLRYAITREPPPVRAGRRAGGRPGRTEGASPG